ncbi:OsmC family protein [Thermosphaera sp.]
MERMEIPKVEVKAFYHPGNSNVVLKARNILREASELPEFGGTGNEFTPLEYMLASLASCEAFMFSMFAKMLIKKVPQVEIGVEGEFSLGEGLKTLRIIYRVAGVEEDLAHAIINQVKASCPIYNTLKKACEKISEEVVVNPSG